MEIRKFALLLGIAPVALGATFFAACGGDDDGGGGGTGSDEAYVADFCEAYKNFFADLEDAQDDITSSDPEDIAETMAQPVEDLAKALKKAKPPKDMQDWHNQAVKTMEEAADELKDGNFDASIFGDETLSDPPEGAADRLQKLAEDNEDCDDAGFDF